MTAGTTYRDLDDRGADVCALGKRLFRASFTARSVRKLLRR